MSTTTRRRLAPTLGPLALALWAASAGRAQAGPVAEAVAAVVEKFRAETEARVSVHAVAVEDGAVLCGIDAEALRVPASNQKILTSAVVLARLGETFRFRTQVGQVGADLVVFGDGDPTTGDERLAADRGEDPCAAFDRWARALKASGVDRIEGDLVVRAGIFQPPMAHPDWPRGQLQRWYAAPVAGVNFSTNCLGVGFRVVGERALPVLSPSSRFLEVDSKVKVAPEHLWSCSFDPTGARVSLRGSVSRTTPDPYPVAVPDPRMLFGLVLADRLVRGGVGFQGRVRVGADPADARGPGRGFRPVAVETTPLADALARANSRSLNMMAECLFLRSAVEDGRAATWETAAERARSVLRQQYGLGAKEFRLADGSGLSKANRATASALTRLLRALAGRKVFLDSLAVSARSGSLRRRLRRHPGQVIGKTGSLAGASALSGYVLDRRGRPVVAFSILTNGRTRGKRWTAKRMEEAICEALIGFVDGEAGKRQ